MTSPNVGSVSVDIRLDDKGLAASIKRAVTSAIKEAQIGKALEEAFSAKPIKVKVQPVFDDKSVPTELPSTPRTRAPRGPKPDPVKVPVEPDLLGKAFQQEIQRQVKALSRQAVKIPAEANTEALQAKLGAQIAEIQRSVKAEIPTEPKARAEYEAKLRAQVQAVAARIQANIPVKADPKNVVGQVRQAARLAQAAAPTVGVKVKADTSVLRSLVSSLTAVGAAGRVAAIGLGGLTVGVGGISAIAGLASAAGQAVPLLASLASVAASAAGSLLALPGAAAIAGAGIGTLLVGLSGIGAALKAAGKPSGGGGGGGVVNTARQIASATRGVESARRSLAAANRGIAASERSLQAAERSYANAQKEVVAAQLAVNKARAEASENLDDLARSLRGARLDEEAAALGVTDALRALNEAKLTGNLPDIQRADLAYRQAQQTLDDAKDSADDLGKQQADAAKKGVEGSDAVTEALARQQAAADGLASASDGLKDAQDGILAAQDSYKSAVDGLAAAQDALAQAQQKTAAGGGGFDAAAAAIAKLAPAAQALVREILALKPAFESVQRAVQQALFAGVAAELGRLASSILPTLRTGLVGIAGELNRGLLAGMRELETFNTRIRLAQIFDSAKKTVGALSTAVRPVIRALLDISGVGSEVVASLAPQFAGFLSDFSAKLSELAKSGELKQIILDGIDTLKQLGAAAVDVGGIIKGIFKAAGAAGDGAGIFGLLDRLNALVNSAAGQSALAELFANLAQVGQALTPVLGALLNVLGPISGAIAQVAVAAAPALTQLVSSLGGALASLAPAIVSLVPLISTMAAGLQPLANILVGLVTAAAPGLNAFLGAFVKGLQALVPVAPVVGQAIGAIFEALAPLLPVIGQALAQALAILAPLISSVATQLTPLISLFGQAFTSALQAILPALLRLGQILLPIAAQNAAVLSRAFAPLLPVIVNLAQVIGAQLLAYLPQFAAVFQQLAPVVAQIATQFGQALLEALLSIVPVLPDLVKAGLDLTLAFLGLFQAVAPLLPAIVPLVGVLIRAALGTGTLSAVLKILMVSIQFVTALVRVAKAVIGTLVTVFVGSANAAAKFALGIKNGATTVYNAARTMVTNVVNAVSGIYQTMIATGKNVVYGIYNGIVSLGSWLYNRVLGFVRANIPGPIQKALGIASPSKVAAALGRQVPAGLAVGMLGNVADVEDAAARISAAAVPSVDMAGLGGLADMKGVAGALTSSAGVELYWAPGATGDPVLDGIRTHIKGRYGGSVTRALGTA